MFPCEYLPEILSIARENNVSYRIGLDMFLNNVMDEDEENDQYFYHGADELDYGAIHDAHPEVDNPAMNAAIINNFNTWYRDNKDTIVPMLKSGDIEGLREFGKAAGKK